jgi:hypothetical protein
MATRVFGFLLLAAAAAACARSDGGAAKAPGTPPDYLAGIPMVPRSIVNDTSSAPGVQHRGMLVQRPMDSVVAFYRRELMAQGWQVMSDVADTGQVSLLLQHGDRSLWVQITSIGPLACQYTLTAARASAPAPAAPR